ncbi:MAG: VTT domain-containing protein [Planctomycetota bacterium]|nr:VTT domain-containing protein [Planctomycetota bacterium]
MSAPLKLPPATPPYLARWRRIVTGCWLVGIAIGLGCYVLKSDQFTPEQLASDFREFGNLMLLIYLIASISRAFVLIPSTPFVLAGCALFPDRPLVVLGTSLLGIAISASLIYFFAESLGLDTYFQKRHAAQFARLECVLRSRWGFWGLVGWAGFPLAPTDLACYVAGSLRMPYWRFLAAVCLGELIVCAFYVFTADITRRNMIDT